MATGGYDDPNEPPIPDDDFDDSDHYDPNTYDDDAVRQALSGTQPFEPGRASTPYHRDEQWEMKTMHSEQTGLPSYAETSFGGVPSTDEISARLKNLRTNKRTGILDISVGIPNIEDASFIKELQNEQKERAIRFIKDRYPQFNEKNLVIGFSKKNPLILVSKGSKGGETEIFLKDGGDFQQKFLNQTYVKNALGRPAETVLKQTSDHIREMQKKREQLRQEQRRYFEA